MPTVTNSNNVNRCGAVRFLPRENRSKVQLQAGCYGFCNLRTQCFHKLLCKGCGWSVCVCVCAVWLSCAWTVVGTAGVWRQRGERDWRQLPQAEHRVKWNSSDSSRQDPSWFLTCFIVALLFSQLGFLSTVFSKKKKKVQHLDSISHNQICKQRKTVCTKKLVLRKTSHSGTVPPNTDSATCRGLVDVSPCEETGQTETEPQPFFGT